MNIAPHFTRAARPRTLWRQLDHQRLTQATGHAPELLEHFFANGQLELHSILRNDRTVGTLILYFQPEHAGNAMIVYWCEMRPARWDHDWLVEAAEYLKLLAQDRGCSTIQACVDLGRKDEGWRRRLEAVGFTPTLVQLELKP